jgi:hypothetical protein
MKYIILLALLSGCAGMGLQQRAQRWVGKSQQDVLTQWGPPASTFKDNAGNEYYTYVSRGPATTTVGQTGFMQQGLITTQSGCKTIYVFNPLGVVENVRWEGQCR